MIRRTLLAAAIGAALTLPSFGQDGLSGTLSTLYRTSGAQTRSISPENFTGEKGKGGMATTGTGQNAAKYLGRGWKVSPSIRVNAGERAILADLDGQGAVQHIWLTPAVAATTSWRSLILRIWWDGEKDPSVEVPLGDFFAMGLGQYAQVNSLAVTVNPGSAFNSYWVMPFRKHMRIEVENRAKTNATLYFQIDYALDSVPANAGTFHAQFRQVRPLPDKTDYVILDGVRGKGQYVGTYMTYGIAHSGWWGEGEIKFFLDGDREFPTIAGTGTEDYFNGSYDFVSPLTRAYQEFSGPYTGLWPVSLAHHRPGALPVRSEGDHPGPGLAAGWRGPCLPPDPGEHVVGGLLVPARRAHAVSGSATGCGAATDASVATRTKERF